MKQKYDLFSADFGQEAYEAYAQMRVDDPVYEYLKIPQPDPVLRWLGVEGNSIWFVSRFNDVHQILQDGHTFVCDHRLVSAELSAENHFADPFLMRLAQNHLLSLDGDDHQRLRSLVNKAFSPRTVRALRPKVQHLANHCLDKVAETGGMEIMNDYAFPLSITVIAELLGVPTNRRDDFRRWADAVFVMESEIPASREQLVEEFEGYLRQLIAARKQIPGDDLLSRLILAEIEGEKLNEIELYSMVFLLLVAGHQTTMSAIGNGTLVLLQHPAAWNTLHNEPGLMPNAVEELLRYESPLSRTAIPRWVTRDIELGGYLMRRGDMIIAILSSANRDETQFACADSLDIERKPNPHLAFGNGIHYCLGAPLARMESEIAFNTLIQRFPDLELSINFEEIVWRPTPSLRCVERLPVRWNVDGK